MMGSNTQFGPNDRIFNIESDKNYNFHAKLGAQIENHDEIIDPFENIDMQCKYSNINETINKMKINKGLKILSWNIRSLASNFLQFKEFLNSFQMENCFFDIIALTEVWSLKDSSLFQIDNYNLTLKSRVNSNGGGICFFIKKEIPFKEIKSLSIFEEKVIESLSLELDLGKNNKIIVSNIYRSNCAHHNLTQADQNDRFLNIFSGMQAEMSSLKHPSYIMGDLNYDLLKFEQHEKTKVLLQNSFANGFLELISIPTRISHTSATLIDHLYTNDIKNKFESSVIISDISDHFPICHIIHNKEKVSNPTFVKTQNFNAEKVAAFKEQLSRVDWNSVLTQEDTQLAYDSFYGIFNRLYTHHFPIKNIRFDKNIHSVEPFMSRSILKSRKTKFELAEIKIRFPTVTNISKYNLYKKCYDKVIRAAKKLYFKHSFEQNKNNLRKTWDILRKAIRKKNDKTSLINEIYSDGLLFSNSKDISNKFNEYFTNVADNITNNLNSSDRDCSYYLTESNSNFLFDEINTFDLVKIVSSLESKASQDMFGLSNNLIKKVIDNIAFPLTHIFNLSLQSGIIPNELKMAKVIPIFKLNSKDAELLSDMSNYRPISLLSIFSKILEKIVALKLTEYLNANNLLYKHQYGFQKKKSTVQPIIHLLNEIVNNSNEKKVSIGVFCDLKKAFDCCSHRILLIKLAKLGVRNRELKWFENYLNNRQQFVSVNDENSNMRFISKGVPQGSILGPLLFLIYINDLATCTNLLTLLFADDTTFLISGKNIGEVIELLNIELKKISYWFRTNELSLHPSKTQFVIFSKNDENYNFHDINIVVNHNNENQNNEDLITKLSCVNINNDLPAIKFLGVYLDPKLNFKYHIDTIQSKISRSLYAINTAKHLIDKSALKTLYNSLIHSHLNYCIPIWGSAAKSHLNKLELQQKRAVRIITNSNYNAHTVPIFKFLEILPIMEQMKYSKLQIMYDYINHRLPCSFDHIWIRNDQRAERLLRNARSFDIPFVRLQSFKNFPLSDFPRLWNEIIIANTDPNVFHNNNVNILYTFTEIMTKRQFSKKLKKLLLDKLTLLCRRDNCTECN